MFWNWIKDLHPYNSYASLTPVAITTDIVTALSFLLILSNLPTIVRNSEIKSLRLPAVIGALFVLMSVTQLVGFYWESYYFMIAFKVVAAFACVLIAIFSGELRNKVMSIRHKLEKTVILEQERNAAETANQLKTAFLANMSHEIRTPLAAILGFSEYLLEPNHSDDERLNAILAIRRNGEYLSNLVSEVLDLSKIESGHLEIEAINFNLKDMLDYIDSVMGFKARDNGIRFKINVGPNVPDCIESDPTRFRQILLNILGNALKFTIKGSVELNVDWKVTNPVNQIGELSCEVHDTGIGMSADQQRKLFMPFSQADTSMTRKFGGTGLGLLLARKLARALGGDVQLAESIAGIGTKFKVTIVAPAVEMGVNEGEQKRIEKLSKTTIFDDLRLLIVEDSVDNQAIIHWMLEPTGASMQMAENGVQGVATALSSDFDVILMDLQMPGMDGYEATKMLRSRGYIKPIIALTAHASREDRERSFLSGFDDHITKPINKAALFHVISHYASRADKDSLV